jgi:hypothetical protein
LSLAAVFAGFGYFFNALPYGHGYAQGTIQLELKILSFLWMGAWLLAAAAVLTQARSTQSTPTRDGAPNDRRIRYLMSLGLGLALVGVGALLCAVGLFSPESSLSIGLLPGVGLVAGLVGGAILAGTVFALAARSALENRETGARRPRTRSIPGFVAIDLALGAGVAICLVGWALVNKPGSSHWLSPIEGLLLTVLGAAVVAGTVLVLALRTTHVQRDGPERHRLPRSFWFFLAVGFALFVLLVANAVLTEAPLIGINQASVTTAYAACALSFGFVAIALFAAAARSRGPRRDLTVAASGFLIAMLGSTVTGAVLQSGGPPRWISAGLTVTALGFLVIATAAGHRALGTRRPPDEIRETLWVGAVSLGPRLHERGAVEA